MFCLLRFSSFRRYACENVNKLLVGNKSDLEAKRAVTTEEAKVGREKKRRGKQSKAVLDNNGFARRGADFQR